MIKREEEEKERNEKKKEEEEECPTHQRQPKKAGIIGPRMCFSSQPKHQIPWNYVESSSLAGQQVCPVLQKILSE